MTSLKKTTHKKSAKKLATKATRKARVATPDAPYKGFGTRLNVAMELLGLSASSLADRMQAFEDALPSQLSVKRQRWDTSRVTRYQHGKGAPNFLGFKNMAQELGLSADWLLFGEGPPLRGQSRNAQSLAEDFDTMLRREIVARLKPEEMSFAAPEQMDINFSAIVARTVDESVTTLRWLLDETRSTFYRALRIRRVIKLLQFGKSESISPEGAFSLARQLGEDNKDDFFKLHHIINGVDGEGRPHLVRLTEHAFARVVDVANYDPFVDVQPASTHDSELDFASFASAVLPEHTKTKSSSD